MHFEVLRERAQRGLAFRAHIIVSRGIAMHIDCGGGLEHLLARTFAGWSDFRCCQPRGSQLVALDGSGAGIDRQCAAVDHCAIDLFRRIGRDDPRLVVRLNALRIAIEWVAEAAATAPRNCVDVARALLEAVFAQLDRVGVTLDLGNIVDHL